METRQERTTRPFRRLVVVASRLIGWIVVVLGLITLTPLAYYYGNPLREPSRPQPSDVIVLLSHGQLDDQWLSPEGAQRTWAALKLYRSGFAPRIISSGSSHGGLDQAGLQAKWLMLAGVPSQAILVERQSSRTYQSALEVVKILKANGWQSAVIVTSELDVPEFAASFASWATRILPSSKCLNLVRLRESTTTPAGERSITLPTNTRACSFTNGKDGFDYLWPGSSFYHTRHPPMGTKPLQPSPVTTHIA